MTDLSWSQNQSNFEDVMAHFRRCPPFFIESLMKRVNLADYVQKICDQACRIEAWEGLDLVGLLAFYRNDDPGGFDFITNVSVSNLHARRGIGAGLVERCLLLSRSGSIRLEIELSNHAAINLYQKYGFLPDPAQPNHLILYRIGKL